jgi:hypothetical protein
MDAPAQDDGLSGTPSPALLQLRWYQFRLRTLLAAVTAAVGLLVAWRVFGEPYRRQPQTMALVGKLGGNFESEAGDLWQLWLFGADYQNIRRLNLSDCDVPVDYAQRVADLPRLQMLAVGGLAFGDEHLRQLRRLSSLRTLILDSTAVSPEALTAWRARRPDVEVIQTQRRAIKRLEELGMTLGTRDEAMPNSAIAVLSPEHCPRVVALWSPRHGRGPPTYLGRRTDLVVRTRSAAATDGAFRLSANDMKQIATLATLEYLNLQDAPLEDATLPGLESLQELEELVLNRTAFPDAGMARLAGLPRLQRLHLDGTGVTDDGLEHLEALPSLKVLDVAGTQVTDVGLVRLTGMQELRFLDVRGTRVTFGGVTMIRGQLPDCQVHSRW